MALPPLEALWHCELGRTELQLSGTAAASCVVNTEHVLLQDHSPKYTSLERRPSARSVHHDCSTDLPRGTDHCDSTSTRAGALRRLDTRTLLVFNGDKGSQGAKRHSERQAIGETFHSVRSKPGSAKLATNVSIVTLWTLTRFGNLTFEPA
jgi:hypothetical protein